MTQTLSNEATTPASPRLVSDKAIEGKDGFLFLGGADANELEAHLTGAKGVQRGAHTIWSENHRARRPLAENLHGVIVPGAQFHGIVILSFLLRLQAALGIYP